MEVNQQLSIDLIENDPDGNGFFNYTWQSSSNSKDWTTIASGASLTVSENLEGLNVQALVNYTDGDGFFESIRTESLSGSHQPIRADTQNSSMICFTCLKFAVGSSSSTVG